MLELLLVLIITGLWGYTLSLKEENRLLQSEIDRLSSRVSPAKENKIILG